MMSELEIMNQYYTIEIILKLYQIGIRFEFGRWRNCGMEGRHTW